MTMSVQSMGLKSCRGVHGFAFFWAAGFGLAVVSALGSGSDAGSDFGSGSALGEDSGSGSLEGGLESKNEAQYDKKDSQIDRKAHSIASN